MAALQAAALIPVLVSGAVPPVVATVLIRSVVVGPPYAMAFPLGRSGRPGSGSGRRLRARSRRRLVRRRRLARRLQPPPAVGAHEALRRSGGHAEHLRGRQHQPERARQPAARRRPALPAQERRPDGERDVRRDPPQGQGDARGRLRQGRRGRGLPERSRPGQVRAHQGGEPSSPGVALFHSPKGNSWKTFYAFPPHARPRRACGGRARRTPGRPQADPKTAFFIESTKIDNGAQFDESMFPNANPDPEDRPPQEVGRARGRRPGRQVKTPPPPRPGRLEAGRSAVLRLRASVPGANPRRFGRPWPPSPGGTGAACLSLTIGAR